MTEKFDLQDTNICKGIAILFMVLHHVVGLYYDSFDPSWYTANSDGLLSMMLLFLSTSGKVCVSVFTILSGYGIYKKYVSLKNNESDFGFAISRIFKFYSIYLPVFLFISIFRFLKGAYSLSSYFLQYGKSVPSVVLGFGADIVGLSALTGTYSIIGDWFVSAIIIFYIISPIAVELVKKYRFSAIILTFIPVVMAMLKTGIKPDVFYGYLPEFFLGILFAQEKILDKFKSERTLQSVILSGLFLIIGLILRIVFSMTFDLVFALTIVFFEVNVLSKTSIASKMLSFFGKHSANIWLLNGICINILWRLSEKKLLYYILVLLFALTISVLIEKIKFILNNKQI